MSEEKQEKLLVIVRGISGSGKSTLCKTYLEKNKEGQVFSTDEFFIKNGKYIFNGKLIGKAHEWNQKRSIEAMEKSCPLILIDNTNTCKWEAKPYVEAGLKYGYNIVITEPTTPWCKDAEELAKRNEHGVPLEAIKMMLNRWEKDFTIENILESEPPKRTFKKK
jgi:predicted kinase